MKEHDSYEESSLKFYKYKDSLEVAYEKSACINKGLCCILEENCLYLRQYEHGQYLFQESDYTPQNHLLLQLCFLLFFLIFVTKSCSSF